MKQPIISLAAILSAASVALPSVAEDAPLESQLEVAVVIEESRGETLQPADRIAPGAVLQYSLDYQNNSEEPFEGFTILGPIPENTEFLPETESADRRSVFEAKVEGLDWARPPITRQVTDADGVLRPVEVPASEYTAVRWRLAEPLEPGETASALYRVRVAD